MFPPNDLVGLHPKRCRHFSKGKNCGAMARRPDALTVSIVTGDQIGAGIARRIAGTRKESSRQCRPGQCFEFSEIDRQRVHQQRQQQAERLATNDGHAMEARCSEPAPIPMATG